MAPNGAQGDSNNKDMNGIKTDVKKDDNDIERTRNDEIAHHFSMEVGPSFASVEELILEANIEIDGNFNINKDCKNRKRKQNEEETVVTYGMFMCTDKSHKEDPKYSIFKRKNVRTIRPW